MGEPGPERREYPPWREEPRRKMSPVAVILISGSVVVALLMVGAFLAFGEPGFLQPSGGDVKMPPPHPEPMSIVPGPPLVTR